MDIAAMNVRVTFQENRTVTDRIGNHKNSWEDCYSCFATVGGEASSSKGGEAETAGTVNDHADASFTVRWCAETVAISSTRNRLVFNGEIYNIIGIDHLSFKKRAVKFRCRKEKR